MELSEKGVLQSTLLVLQDREIGDIGPKSDQKMKGIKDQKRNFWLKTL